MSPLEPKFTRRSALSAAAMGGLGLATAGMPPGLAAAAPLKGNLKHSVCRWTLSQQSLAQLCQTVKGNGFAAIDLIGPEEWPILKANGV